LAAIGALLAAAAACGGASERDQRKAVAAPFPFNERIGWLHGPCLAILNADLASGTPVALVIMGEPQRIQQARVKERTTSGATCHVLMDGRAAMNAKAGTFFYALDAGNLESTAMGFGIIAPPASPEVVNGLARVDLDQNGQAEVFSSCATSEGIKFNVWTGKRDEGEPRWSGYYYVDYDITPNCP
jgi:hypothetical protein